MTLQLRRRKTASTEMHSFIEREEIVVKKPVKISAALAMQHPLVFEDRV